MECTGRATTRRYLFMRGSEMNIRESLMRIKVYRVLAFLLFVVLLWQVFAHLTYLFRNTNDARVSFLTFKDEPQDSLDVVYFGASDVFVFWNPMCAWNQNGFTSYDYSASNMPCTTYLPLIKASQEVQRPKLYVVGVRTFLSPFYNQISSSGIVNDGGYRNVADSMDLSFERAKLISYTCKINPTSDKNSIGSYLDLIYYHANHESLSKPRNWFFLNNTTGNSTGAVVSPYFFKGYMADPWLTAKVALFPGFLPPETERRLPLCPEAERCYRELLSYCSDNDIPLLITATPKISDEDFEAQINTCEDIAAEYDIPFLDLNSPACWKEMGLDPETDFYNVNHVNISGAGKFTAFLADYLATNYNLPDHRKDPRYDSWNVLNEESYLPNIEPLQEQVRNIVAEYKKTIENEEKMRQTKDAAEWFSYADDPNITLLMAAYARNENMLTSETGFILDKFGLSPYFREKSDTYVGVYSGSVRLSDIEMVSYEGDTVTYNNDSSYKSVHYSICLGEEASVRVDGNEYAFENGSGINIVVIDNNLLSVVDCTSVDVDSEGKLTLKHIELD